MTSLDYLTIAFYIVGLFVISTLSARRTSNQRQMFSAGRQSPWWASGLSGFMTMFSAGTFVVWGGVAYEYGFVAVMINSCYGISALLVGYFVAGHWSRLNVETPAQFVQLRFGDVGLQFFTWTMLTKRILGVSVSLYALAILLIALIPLDLNWAIVLFGSIVTLYTMQGGLWAVLMTDVLQFLVLTVMVLLVAVLMLMDVGSVRDFRAEIPETFFSPVAGSYGWLFLAGWVTIHFFMIGAEWAFVQRFLAVRSPDDAKKSAYLFGVMYLVTPLFWLLPPMLYRGQVAGADKEQAYILAAQSVLPAGVLGLMVAAMFSATASMVSSQLNVFAGVLTNDFYRSKFSPQATEQTLVRIGRCFTILLGVLLVVAAMTVPRLGGAEKLIVSINSLLVVPLYAPTLWGLFSKGIGIRDMLVVALTSFSIGVILKFGLAENPWIVKGGDLWPLANYLHVHANGVEVIVGVILPVVMLALFELMRQSVDQGSERLSQHCRNIAEENLPEQHFVADPFAARMVVASLSIIGAWILLLAVLQSEDRIALSVFGIGLLIAALTVKRFTPASP